MQSEENDCQILKILKFSKTFSIFLFDLLLYFTTYLNLFYVRLHVWVWNISHFLKDSKGCYVFEIWPIVTKNCIFHGMKKSHLHGSVSRFCRGAFWPFSSSKATKAFNTILAICIWINLCLLYGTSYTKVIQNLTDQNSMLTSILTKWQKDSFLEVGISRKSIVSFEGEGLWTHNNYWNFSEPEVNFENDLKIHF